MFDVMKDRLYGHALAGAGGGGFMFLVSKNLDDSNQIEELVRGSVSEHVQFHKIAIDTEGLVVRVESQ